MMLLRAYNSGQRLENVNQTHLVLASGKQALQKRVVTYTITLSNVPMDPFFKSAFELVLIFNQWE